MSINYDSYRKFTKNVGIIGISKALVVIGSLNGIILMPILTKNLNIIEYGIFVQLIIIIGLIMPIATLSLVPYTLVRYIAGEKDKNEIQDIVISTSIIIFLISFIIALIIIFFSETILSKYLGDAAESVKIVALILPFWCTSQVFSNYFRALQKMGWYSFFLTVQTYGEVLFVAYFVLSGQGVYGAILAIFIARVCLFFVSGYFVFKEIGIAKPKFLQFKKHINFSIPMMLNSISLWAVDVCDRYVIGFFLGSLYVGFYNPGYVLSKIMEMFMSPFQLILPSVLADHFDNGRLKEVQTILRYTLKYFLLIAIPAVFGLSILSKTLLTLLTTKEIAINGYFVVYFAATGMFFLAIGEVFKNILILYKNTKIIGIIWLFLAILNISINIILVPKIGILGAAISTTVTYILSTLLNAHYAFKYVKFIIEWGFIGKSIAASAIMSIAIYYLNPFTLFDILTTIVIGIGIYGVLIAVSNCFSKEELIFFRRIVPSRISKLK